MRGLLAMMGLAAAFQASVPAQDAREIVRRALQADNHNAEQQHRYTYLQREETRELDPADKTKRLTIRTVEISMMEGSPYRRLVARDDRALAPAEQKQEEEKLRFNLDVRRKESTEARQRRIAEWMRREDKRREPLREVPDAYDFKLAGEETVNGAPCWRIDATPKPGYKPKSSATAVLSVLTGSLWISKQDYGWVKTEMRARDSFSLGAFLLRLSKGSSIAIEQTPAGDGVWLPKSVEIKFSARLLLVKGLREDLRFGFSDYRKPDAEERSGAADR